MQTLRIEHAITDFEVWRAAFDRFDGPRRQAGVRSYRVFRPSDDPKYVMIDLDFETSEGAEGFLEFLTTTVWPNKENAPGLGGTPQTRFLNLAASD